MDESDNEQQNTRCAALSVILFLHISGFRLLYSFRRRSSATIKSGTAALLTIAPTVRNLTSAGGLARTVDSIGRGRWRRRRVIPGRRPRYSSKASREGGRLLSEYVQPQNTVSTVLDGMSSASQRRLAAGSRSRRRGNALARRIAGPASWRSSWGRSRARRASSGSGAARSRLLQPVALDVGERPRFER